MHDVGYIHTENGKARLGWPVVACAKHVAQPEQLATAGVTR